MIPTQTSSTHLPIHLFPHHIPSLYYLHCRPQPLSDERLHELVSFGTITKGSHLKHPPPFEKSWKSIRNDSLNLLPLTVIGFHHDAIANS